MANSQQDVNAFVAFNQFFKIQPNIKTPLADILHDVRHPQTTPTRPQRQRNRVTVYHCNGMDIFEEKITDQYSRWTFGFPASAQLIAGWGAMNYGSTLTPSQTPQNEIQTIAKVSTSVTSGTFDLSHTFEGKTGGATLIPWNISAANLKILLESGVFETIEAGDIASVTGADINAGYVVTFSSTGKLRKADVSAFVIDGTSLDHAAAVTETQKGANKLHPIARSVSPQLPETSFIIGFEDDSTPAKKHQSFVCDGITVEATNRQDLVCTVELIGSAKKQDAIDFIVPNCVVIDPINTRDCRLRVDGNYVTDLLNRFKWERKNNVPVGNDAFPWDSKDVGLLWRSPKPTESFTAGIYGSEGDTIYTIADAELNKPVILDIGVPGDRFQVNFPNMNIRLDSQDLAFDGDLKRSVIGITGTPYFDSGISASSNAKAWLDQTQQFLQLPS